MRKILLTSKLIKARFFRAEQSRKVWIDVLRGVGILIVLLGHCLPPPPFYEYICAFHMPLFFLISGYLYKRKKISEFLTISFARYVVPYFCLAFFMLVIETVTCAIDYTLIPHYIFGILYSRGTVEWMPSCSPLWFLTCLVMALLFFNLIMLLNKTWHRIVLVILCCAVSYTLDCANCFKLPWNIDTSMMAVGFIGIGYIVSKKEKQLFDNRWVLLFIPSSAILGLLSASYNTHVSFDNNEYGNIFFMFASALLLSYALSCTIYHFHPLATIFSFYGRHTIFIMGFDYFTIKIAGKVASIIGLQNWMSVFILKVFAITIGIYVWYWMINLIKNEKLQKLLRF